MRSEKAYLRLAALMAVVGAIAAAGLSFPMERYESSAVLRINPAHGGDVQASGDLELMQQEILSRSSLAEMIQRPSLRLYRGERARVPMEKVIERMRRDIQIRRVPGDRPTFSVSFSYPDRFLAQAVTRELVTKFVETNMAFIRNRTLMWQGAWNETSPPGETMEVLRPANDPQRPIPNLLVFVACGLGVGAGLGLLAVAALRQRKRTLQLAAFAVTGCALAATVAFLLPSRYLSTAAMRITPPVDPNRWYAGRTAEPVPARVQRIAKEVLSEKNLERIAGEVRLEPGDIASMRRNISVRMQRQPLNPGDSSSAFDVSFTCGDARKAQAVVRELVTGFVERTIVEERERMKTAGPEFRLMADHKIGDNLEVLDPASLPQAPVWPNRFVISVMGLGGGLLIGAVMLYLRRPRGPVMKPVAAT